MPPEASSGLVHGNESGLVRFGFDKVFDQNSSQDSVFDEIAKNKVIEFAHVYEHRIRKLIFALLFQILEAFDGVNSTVFAYGQTGSGKTYSIFGGDTFPTRGLIPRALSLVFQEIKRRSSLPMDHQYATKSGNVFTYKCHISFTEVYKELLFDLLDPQKRFQPMEQWTPVQVMEGEGGLTLRNVNVFEVDSEENALKLFFMGNTNRYGVLVDDV